MLGQPRAKLDDRFRELYDRTFDRVYGFVLRRVVGEDEARDIVGDTYMSVWRRIRDVPADPIRAEAWVFATARRVVANHRRSRERRHRLAQRLAHHSRPVVDVDSGAADLPLRALADLPRRYREVLELALWEELSYVQMSAVLGCSEAAVGTRLHRARNALRERYDALEAQGGAS